MFDKEQYLKRLGAYIRHLRILNGYSQDDLARKCGYTADNSRSTIAKIETGKADLPTSKLIVFSMALNVDVTDLINLVDCPNDQVLLLEHFNSLNQNDKDALLDYAAYLKGKEEKDEKR